MPAATASPVPGAKHAAAPSPASRLSTPWAALPSPWAPARTAVLGYHLRPMPESPTLWTRAGQAATDARWAVLGPVSRRLPQAQPERHGVERIDDLRYVDDGMKEHTLDVYRP